MHTLTTGFIDFYGGPAPNRSVPRISRCRRWHWLSDVQPYQTLRIVEESTLSSTGTPALRFTNVHKDSMGCDRQCSPPRISICLTVARCADNISRASMFYVSLHPARTSFAVVELPQCRSQTRLTRSRSTPMSQHLAMALMGAGNFLPAANKTESKPFRLPHCPHKEDWRATDIRATVPTTRTIHGMLFCGERNLLHH